MSRLRLPLCCSAFAFAALVSLGLLADDAPVPTTESPQWIKMTVKGHRFAMEFARIPKGKFTMGSPKTEKDHSSRADRANVLANLCHL